MYFYGHEGGRERGRAHRLRLPVAEVVHRFAAGRSGQCGSAYANGTHYWLDTTGAVWAEDTTGTQFYDLDPINFTATWVTMQFEIAWSKAAGLDGYQLVQSITIFGERLSAHDLGIDWRKGYSATYERPTMWNTSQIAAQPRFPTEHQITVGEEVQALSVRVTDFLWSTKASRPSPPADSGQGARFFGITLELEPLDGAFRVESSSAGWLIHERTLPSSTVRQ